MHGEEFTNILDGGIRLDDLFYPFNSHAVGSLSNQQSTAFTSQQKSDACQQKSNHDRSRRIQVRITKHVPQKDSQECDEGSGQCCRVFEEYGEDGRILAPDDFLPCALVGILACLQFAVGNLPGIKVEEGGEGEHHVIPTCMRGWLGVLQVRNSVIDRQPPAQSEDVHSHQEGIKIEHLAVTVRM